MIKYTKFCRNFCRNLYSEERNSTSTRFYCDITSNLCVADKYGLISRILFETSRLSIDLLLRCPSREEISDKIENE